MYCRLRMPSGQLSKEFEAARKGRSRTIPARLLGEMRSMQAQQNVGETATGRGHRDRHMSLLLVGSEEVFKTDVTERMISEKHLRVVARSSSLLEAKACLESKAIDMVLLSPEYRREELGLFTFEARRCGFAGLILQAADAPRMTAKNSRKEPDSIQIGDFFVHLSSRRVWVRGIETEFRPQEFELLTLLCKHPEELLSYEILLKLLWGNPKASRHLVRVLIRALRSKIETTAHPQYIVTEREAGYRFIPSPAPLP
jgi:DNA-binding winged helix-turn-helix (wHTH) protein